MWSGGAGGDERFGFAPTAVRGEGWALELLPRRRGFCPQIGVSGALGAVVLGFGQNEPAVGVGRDH